MEKFCACYTFRWSIFEQFFKIMEFFIKIKNFMISYNIYE